MLEYQVFTPSFINELYRGCPYKGGHASKQGRSEKQIKRDRKRNKMKPKPKHR